MTQGIAYIYQYSRSWFVKAMVLCGILMTSLSSYAQFTFTDNLRGSQPADIIIGGDALFTSGVVDPVGAGWLRLTPAEHAQQGYAYIDKSFPSTMGVLIDFEYKIWRHKNHQTDVWGYGGDGMSLFLFDGTVPFRLGGWGGSLGYATNSSNPYTIGMGGGYIGLGFDNFGYYASAIEGKYGGLPLDGGSQFDRIPNTISIRGETNDNDATQSNLFLGGVKLGDRSGTSIEVSQRNEVGYTSTLTPTRPADEVFYRRVQVEISPMVSGGYYNVTVRWKRSTSPSESFTELFSYQTQQVPPDLLKLGFAATGNSAINNHEVRNLLVTTPNNMRVNKFSNKDYLRTITTGNANQITYTIEVTNDTDQPYTNAALTDELLDNNGNPIPTSMFTIDGNSIVTNGFTNTDISVVSGENRITGSLSIAPHSTGTIQVTGTLSDIPGGNMLVNRVSVMPTGSDVDFDLGNNTATVSTPVIAEGVDLMLIKNGEGDRCIDPTNGNTYELRIANMGASEATYRRPGSSGNRIVVIKEVPTGYNYIEDFQFTTSANGLGETRWYKSTESIPNGHVGHGGVQFPNGGTRYYYVARYPTGSFSNQTLDGMGNVYETDYPIRYTITPPEGTTSYVDVARVEIRAGGSSSAPLGGAHADIEPPENRGNNTDSETVATISEAPEVVSSNTIVYYVGEMSSPLTATPLPGHSLKWYTDGGTTLLPMAPTPSTDLAGTTRYYVSQTNGECEGPLAYIDVEVRPWDGKLITNPMIRQRMKN